MSQTAGSRARIGPRPLGAPRFAARGLLIWGSVVAVLVASACAPTSKLPQIDKAAAEAEAEKQRQLVIEDRFGMYGRTANIIYPLLQSNADLCKGNTKFSLESVFANKFSLGADYEKSLAQTRGYGEGANLVAIGKGSPLDGSGLQAGDGLVAIGDWKVAGGKEAPKRVVEKIAEMGGKAQTLHLSFDTKSGRREMDVAPRKICAYDFGITSDEEVNAFADGENIFITAGMLRFAQNDTELATVLGHEMAHNVMGHIDKQKGNAAIGLLFDILFAGLGVNTQGGFSKLGAQAYSKEFEAEADYVGLYLMARSGFQADNAANFWRRMALVSPNSVSAALAASHPPSPERFIALEKTAAEIAAKAQSGAALLPEAEIPEARKPANPNPNAPWH